MFNSKKINYIIMLGLSFIFIITGYYVKDIIKLTKDTSRPTITADKVYIYYGVDSTATVLTNEEDVLEMIELYNNMKLGSISRQVNPVDYYSVVYYENDEKVAHLHVYNKGLIKTGSDELYDKNGDVLAYSIARKMYHR